MSKAWSKDVALSLTTFGDSPACLVLADMMNKDIINIRSKHKVLSFIDVAIVEFKSISDIKNPKIGNKILLKSRDYFFECISKMEYPPKFNSHLKNVINYHFRRFLKEAAWTVAPRGEESRSNIEQPAR